MSTSTDLHRLIYCSRAHAETSDLDAHVDEILRVSEQNNRLSGLTGLLLIHGGWFVQALEGEQDAITRTYGRIICDRRHERPTVLAGGRVDARAFTQWKMSARRLPAGGLRRLTFDPTRLGPDAAFALLTTAAALPPLPAPAA